ncbi:MAG: hypothetical protein JSU86_05165 [Phycisphaerales bacterium]|nr:MAG: hypothetical protein JSU86_05165 [Phycisphaerales bacterium]
MNRQKLLPSLLSVLSLAAGPLSGGTTFGDSLLGTAFTYQGQLKQGGVPVDGQADFMFRLCDAKTGGAVIDNVGFSFVGVVDRLFTVELDFGASAFDGSARWLEIEVEILDRQFRNRVLSEYPDVWWVKKWLAQPRIGDEL